MSEAQTGPIRIVVVDDSDDIRDVLRLALDREPSFNLVAEAADGPSGVEVVREHQPQLVLLDISMPEMDGLQALPLIREAAPEAVVVMLTGFTETVGAISAVENGAHGYIQKGGRIPELLAQIHEILDVRLSSYERPQGD